MLKRFIAITTLFSFYIFPANVKANINTLELNYETVGLLKEDAKNLPKDNTSDLASKKTTKSNSKDKSNGFLKFLGLLVFSYALIEILDHGSSSSTTNNNDRIIREEPGIPGGEKIPVILF